MDDSAKTLFALVLLVIIGVFIVTFISVSDVNEQNEVKSTIENTYNVELVSIHGNNWQDTGKLTEVKVRSLNPNDKTQYIAFIEKINDEWKLYQRNGKGEYVELDENAMQTLKEN